MAFTKHGHQIPGTPVEDLPAGTDVARCGGMGFCNECQYDANAYLWSLTQMEKRRQDLIGADIQSTSMDRAKKPHWIMRWFVYDHLSTSIMRDVSREFGLVAQKMDAILPNGPEKSTALRKLLEGKDAAVRAALDL